MLVISQFERWSHSRSEEGNIEQNQSSSESAMDLTLLQ